MYKYIVVPMLAFAMACNSPTGGESASEAELNQHSDEASSFTDFTGGVEFYVEYATLEVGVETEFLIHLTDLETYKPCTSGQVILRVNGISIPSGEPAVPGIFHISFNPGMAGSYPAEFIYEDGTRTRTVDEHIQVYSDHNEPDGEEAEEEHVEAGGEHGEIEFLKEQAWSSDFMVEQIVPGPFHGVIPTSGELMAIPGEKQNITAGSRGIVRFADPMLVQGSAVKADQLLFTISSESLLDDPVQLRYEEAKNRLEKSRSDYRRHRILAEGQAISDRQLLESRSAYVEDSLRYYSLAAHISEQGVTVRAPVSGTIHELMISDGEFTEPGTLLATLSNNRTLMLRSDLPQQYYSQLDQIETAYFRPAYSDQVYSVEEMNGALLAAGVSVAENDHYLPVIFRLDNSGQLLEGAYAEVYLLAEEKSNVLVVPAMALSEEQGAHYLYIQITGESYTKRLVGTGESDGRLVEITSGLNSGERVVTRGVMLIKAASAGTAIVGHEHAH